MEQLPLPINALTHFQGMLTIELDVDSNVPTMVKYQNIS